jgi:hypothetical protein
MDLTRRIQMGRGIKMKKTTALCLCISFAIVLGAAAAQAEDFTFSIPVELSNMHPDVHTGRIYCRVKDEGRHEVASGGANFRLSGGSYHGVVTVAFDGSDPSRVVNAHSYTCTLLFGIEGAMGMYEPDPPGGRSHNLPDTPYTIERLTPAPGSVLRGHVEGMIPR